MPRVLELSEIHASIQEFAPTLPAPWRPASAVLGSMAQWLPAGTKRRSGRDPSPDLPDRLCAGIALTPYDRSTFYGATRSALPTTSRMGD
jgi:hypothetical protein